jgi:hypothetical protein
LNNALLFLNCHCTEKFPHQTVCPRALIARHRAPRWAVAAQACRLEKRLVDVPKLLATASASRQKTRTHQRFRYSKEWSRLIAALRARNWNWLCASAGKSGSDEFCLL